jgi:hypothetical protein
MRIWRKTKGDGATRLFSDRRPPAIRRGADLDDLEASFCRSLRGGASQLRGG